MDEGICALKKGDGRGGRARIHPTFFLFLPGADIFNAARISETTRVFKVFC